MRSLLAAAAAMLIAGSAQASIIVNGSFEQGPNPGSFMTLGTGNTQITGWTVTGGSIDYIGSYWNASNGVRSIDLSGNEPGAIAQSFATIAGRDYVVTFDLAANPDNAITKLLNVTAGENFTQYSYAGTPQPLEWTPQVFNFFALGSQTTLTFAGGNPGPWGAALDNVNVSLVPVPEPATWAMLIAGFGLVGAVARRRRRVTVAA
jgi:choice-of-anchor C domain-containing protein